MFDDHYGSNVLQCFEDLYDHHFGRLKTLVDLFTKLAAPFFQALADAGGLGAGRGPRRPLHLPQHHARVRVAAGAAGVSATRVALWLRDAAAAATAAVGGLAPKGAAAEQWRDRLGEHHVEILHRFNRVVARWHMFLYVYTVYRSVCETI